MERVRPGRFTEPSISLVVYAASCSGTVLVEPALSSIRQQQIAAPVANLRIVKVDLADASIPPS
jgi:hypothetical protein